MHRFLIQFQRIGIHRSSLNFNSVQTCIVTQFNLRAKRQTSQLCCGTRTQLVKTCTDFVLIERKQLLQNKPLYSRNSRKQLVQRILQALLDYRVQKHPKLLPFHEENRLSMPISGTEGRATSATRIGRAPLCIRNTLT